MGIIGIQNKDNTYLHFMDDNIADSLTVHVIAEKIAYNLQLANETDQIISWSQKLKKTPKEYLYILRNALVKLSCPSNEEPESRFELDCDCGPVTLVWKQFFPEKKIFGIKGKFELHQVNFSDCALIIIKEVHKKEADTQAEIVRLKVENAKLAEACNEATNLAASGIRLKEEFESDIYHKFSLLLNEKKARIRQLTLQDSQQIAGTDAHDQSIPSNESLHYDADTDVDDDDDDETDNEGHITKSSVHKSQPKKPKLNVHTKGFLNSSQDEELFNYK